jgi:hypothetical protein
MSFAFTIAVYQLYDISVLIDQFFSLNWYKLMTTTLIERRTFYSFLTIHKTAIISEFYVQLYSSIYERVRTTFLLQDSNVVPQGNDKNNSLILG